MKKPTLQHGDRVVHTRNKQLNVDAETYKLSEEVHLYLKNAQLKKKGKPRGKNAGNDGDKSED